MTSLQRVLCTLALIWLCIRRPSVYGCCWEGATYWNDRYQADGLTIYEAGEEFYHGLWSTAGSSVYDHYHLHTSSYSGRTCGGGCTCDETTEFGGMSVKGCSGTSVTVKYYSFHNLTGETFSAGVENIWIQDAAVFTHVENNTFELTTSLEELVIHKTGLIQLPDLHFCTSLTKAVLSLNSIQFFIGNHTNHGWPSTLRSLSLIDNNIDWVPPGLFSSSNIEYLALSRNNIWYFPSDAFENMPNLKFLGLNENTIQSISSRHLEVFAAPNSLQHLNLSHNEIYMIGAGAIKQVVNLNVVELDYNSFTTIMPGIFDGMTNLMHLGLSHNELTILKGDTFTDSQELRILDLSHQDPGLTNIYYNSMNNINQNLRELWVSSNSLTSFPHQVLSNQQYDELESVFADANSIDDPLLYGEDGFPPRGSTWESRKLVFEPWVTSPNIGRLWLGSNGIPEIHSDDFCVLTSLWELHLQNNLLTEETTPTDCFSCLTSLTVLYLGYNEYDFVPTAVRSAEYLPVINNMHLEGNHITYIEEGALSDLSTLSYLVLHSQDPGLYALEDNSLPKEEMQQLFLYSNNFDFTHKTVFSNMTQLWRLWLHNNQIEVIPDEAFDGSTALVELYLQNNEIKRLMKTHFEDNPLTDEILLHNNDIGFIEDGTFAHMTTVNHFTLYNNKLTELPNGGDFTDFTLNSQYGNLQLQNNRITRIKADTFKNVYVNYNIYLNDNRIGVIETGAFSDVNTGYSIHLQNNLMRAVESEAFSSITTDNIYLQNMYIDHIPTHAFVDINSYYIHLQNNEIVYIDEEAFDVSVYGVYLQNNDIALIMGQMFQTGSTVTYNLNLNNNQLTAIPTEAFEGLTISSSGQLYLTDNLLYEYPLALSPLSLRRIDLTRNSISAIDSTAFTDQTNLESLILSDNAIAEIPTGLFTTLVNLETLDLGQNSLTMFDTNELATLDSLLTLDLADNQIFHVGAIPNITSLQSVDASNNVIETLGIDIINDVAKWGSFVSLDIIGAQVSCDCQLLDMLLSTVTNAAGAEVTIGSFVTGGECTTPTTLAGTLLGVESSSDPNYYLAKPTTDFLCSPENVTVVSDNELMLNVSWDGPLKVDLFSTGPVGDVQYEVTCKSTVGSITTTTTATNHTFTEADGVTGDIQYACYVAALVTNGTGVLSGYSTPGIVTAMEKFVEANVTVAVNDIVLPITYYDFSTLHPDFTYLTTTVEYKDPTYVPSPYGAWLAFDSTPSDDTTSDWFREIVSNYMFDKSIILTGITGPPLTNRFYDASFFPVDNLGYTSQGKLDCSLAEHNFGFTSAIRSGFVFQGDENVTLGGGEETWLFLNRILVLQLNNDPLATAIPCKTVNIAAAADSGGGIVTPWEGTIVAGECVATTELVAEQVELEFDIGERYHFTAFHVERQGCASEFFLEAQGFDFITDPIEEPPRDYLVKIDEDLHVDGIVETLFLSDTFSSGPPFIVKVLRGNEAGHFDFVNNTAAAQTLHANPPATPAPVYSTVGNYTFVECDSPAVKLTESNTTGEMTYWSDQETMLAVLQLAVDYEVATEYVMVLEVIDYLKTPSLTGQVTLKVKLNDINDNCPILTQRDYVMSADPALQPTPIISLNVSDEDSTVNSELQFYRNDYVLSPPLSYNDTTDILTQTWPQQTEVSFTVVAMDKGSPTRGTWANVTVEMSNTCLVDLQHELVDYNYEVDVDTGEIYLVIPGYYHRDFFKIPEKTFPITYGNNISKCLDCDDVLGMEAAIITDFVLSASTEQDYSAAYRARLNITYDSYSYNTGGWLPTVNDKNQWIQVDMQDIYYYNQLWLQGREDDDHWVLNFTIYTSDDGGNFTKYSDANGNDVLPGTTDRDTVHIHTFDPRPSGRYFRINPQGWNGHIALRFEILGCLVAEQEYSNIACSRCDATYRCLGDGLQIPCGRCENETVGCSYHPTEHTFGGAQECSPCPDGWLCHEGYATPCPDFHYSTCNSTWCPENCTACEPGYACRGGVRYLCGPGEYSLDGQLEYCDFCTDGTYVNATGSTSCLPCDPGYSSTTGKDRCEVCEAGTYSDGSGATCQPCSDVTECPCLATEGPCFFMNSSAAGCINTGSGGYGCLDCPHGFTGDGQTCTDIDECANHAPCFNTSCRNTAPGYQCEQCPNGYSGTYEDAIGYTVHRRNFEDACSGVAAGVITQGCEDINECDTDNGKCDPNAYCINTVGSFRCGECKPGWVAWATVIFPYGCRPANFCASAEDNDCDEHAECSYIGPGLYKCDCVNGWAGDGSICAVDEDQDGISTNGVSCRDWGCKKDNCPDVSNAGQEDNDEDGLGDACDPDDDNDQIYDYEDNCPFTFNPGQEDADSDYVGDACDNCPSDQNTDQSDVNGDGLGDVCDSDSDSDGIADTSDICPLVYDPSQLDADGDGVGDGCDNCPATANAAQADSNQDGVGDACDDGDTDGDGIVNYIDNCPITPNGNQGDTDSDGAGDDCDSDLDGDGVLNNVDNCPWYPNADQTEITGNGVGDVCEDDTDGDGVIDRLDNCPKDPHMNATNFQDYTAFNLDPTSSETDVAWMILFEGAEIRQAAETNATAILLSKDPMGPMKYSGTWFVNHDDCWGYIGFVFGFQGDNKFYAVMWRHRYWNWYDSHRAGIKGLQLKLIESVSGPSQTLAEAMWHTDDTTDEVTLLWHDPHLVGWECKQAYRWELTHQPDIGQIRIIAKIEETVVVDSGDIYDTTISGGKPGLFVHAQPGIIFSNLKYECLDRVNEAMQFDGVQDYLNVSDLFTLEIQYSFTWEVWVYLTTPSSAVLPVICNSDQTQCLYLEESGGDYFVRGRLGSSIAEGATALPMYSWTQLVMRYDAEGYSITLYVNGTGSGAEAQVTDVPPIDWDNDVFPNNITNTTDIFIATDLTNYFDGIMDEIRMYSIFIYDSEIDSHWQKAGLFWEYHKRYLEVHYNFDNNNNDAYVEDKALGWNVINAEVYGAPTYVSSYVDQSRFTLTHPSNRRRRRRSIPQVYGPMNVYEDVYSYPYTHPENHDVHNQSVLPHHLKHMHRNGRIIQPGTDPLFAAGRGGNSRMQAFKRVLEGHDEF